MTPLTVSVGDAKHCDEEIINHVQDAIVHIKQSQQQCNIARIFGHLKERLAGHAKIGRLTEKCLIRQLEMAVRDGILSRKYGSSVGGGGGEEAARAAAAAAHEQQAAGGRARASVRLPVGELTLKLEAQVGFGWLPLMGRDGMVFQIWYMARFFYYESFLGLVVK